MCAVFAITTQSCTKNFDNLNKNPAQFYSPDPETVFSGAVKNMVETMGNNNVDRLWEYSHIIYKGNRYTTGDENGSVWQRLYVRVLSNLQQIKVLYKDNPLYTNRLQIAEIWQCYTYAYLVAMYGPVPYSQALNPDITEIKFDGEAEIYTSLLSRLKIASDAIKLDGDKFSPDIMYGGDLLKWKKFANSLRLRLALRSQLVIPEVSAAAITDIMSNESVLLSAEADNAKVAFGQGDGNESPYFVKLLKNSVDVNQQPKMSDYVYLYFRSYNDPRLTAFYEPVDEDKRFAVTDTLESTVDDTIRVVTYKVPYLGSPKSTTLLPAWGLTATSPLSGSTIANFNSLKASILAPGHPFMVMDYAEVCFMKAEAKYLNLGGSKTADQYYYEGIDASFNFWGVGGQVLSYKAQDGIKWNTEGKGFNNYIGLVNANIPANNLNKIWIQRWINYYPDGAFDLWCLQRRTLVLDLPTHTNPGNPNLNAAFLDLPARWEYPLNEKSYNAAGYNDAVAKLNGRDFADTFLKFEKTYVHRNWTLAHAAFDGSSLLKWYGTTIQDLTNSGIAYKVVSKYKKP